MDGLISPTAELKSSSCLEALGTPTKSPLELKAAPPLTPPETIPSVLSTHPRSEFFQNNYLAK